MYSSPYRCSASTPYPAHYSPGYWSTPLHYPPSQLFASSCEGDSRDPYLRHALAARAAQRAASPTRPCAHAGLVPTARGVGGQEFQTAPEWFLPCAERLYRRFPDVFYALGEPSLMEKFHLPPNGGSQVQSVTEIGGPALLRINLKRRESQNVVNAPHQAAGRDWRALDKVGDEITKMLAELLTLRGGSSGSTALACCAASGSAIGDPAANKFSPAPRGTASACNATPSGAVPPAVRSSAAVGERKRSPSKVAFASHLGDGSEDSAESRSRGSRIVSANKTLVATEGVANPATAPRLHSPQRRNMSKCEPEEEPASPRGIQVLKSNWGKPLSKSKSEAAASKDPSALRLSSPRSNAQQKKPKETEFYSIHSADDTATANSVVKMQAALEARSVGASEPVGLTRAVAASDPPTPEDEGFGSSCVSSRVGSKDEKTSQVHFAVDGFQKEVHIARRISDGDGRSCDSSASGEVTPPWAAAELRKQKSGEGMPEEEIPETPISPCSPTQSPTTPTQQALRRLSNASDSTVRSSKRCNTCPEKILRDVQHVHRITSTPTTESADTVSPLQSAPDKKSQGSLLSRRKMSSLSLRSDVPSRPATLPESRWTSLLLENTQASVQLLYPPGGDPRGFSRCSDDKSQGSNNANSRSPERDAVISLPRCALVRTPQPLPGSFSTRRTLIFMDWDDTLCPTTWIRGLLKDTLADMEAWEEWYNDVPRWFNHQLPDNPIIGAHMAALQKAVKILLEAAQEIGIVCIVTNGAQGWVDKTINKWLPELRPYISGHGKRPMIHVLYAQSFWKHPRQQSALGARKFVDLLGPHMWWKQAAMCYAIENIDELYRLSVAKTQSSPSWTSSASAKYVTNIVSLGDSEAEMQAAELAAYQCPQAGGRPRRFRSSLAEDLVSEGQRRPGSPHRTFMRSASRISLPSKWQRCDTCTSLPPSNRGHRPWVKLAKLEDEPDVRNMCRQLFEFAALLPHIAAARRDLRVDFSESGLDASPVPSSNNSFGEGDLEFPMRRKMSLPQPPLHALSPETRRRQSYSCAFSPVSRHQDRQEPFVDLQSLRERIIPEVTDDELALERSLRVQTV